MSEEIMLTEQQQAEALHKQITGYGEVIYQSLYGMCTAIKQMRDSKLYKALGYDTFEAYTEEKLGMKRAQAYTYIAIADRLSDDFVQSTGQIGIQKLYLLAMASEETRTEIVRQNDLTETTVKELREQIAQLTADRDELAADRQREGLRADRLAREAKEKDEQISALQSAKETAEADAAQARDAVRGAEEAKERNRLTLRGIIDKKVELVHQLEAKVKELESRPIETAVVDHTEEIDTLKKEIESLRQQLSEKPDTQLSLGVEPIYQTDSKALFKPYLTAAADAVNRLAEFIAQHQSDANYDFFMEKMHAAFAFADQKIQAMKG